MSTHFVTVYPPTLQHLVRHADRLCDLIAVHELAPPRDEWAAAWLHGRAEEMAMLAQDVLDSWRDGRMEEAKASATLEAYLTSLYEGLAKHLPKWNATSSACLAAPPTNDVGGWNAGCVAARE